MAANSTNYGKLNELTKIKDDLEAQLMGKMERWEYLMAKAEEIEKQK
jgi:ATP-binding cassette subfamily F protein uup